MAKKSKQKSRTRQPNRRGRPPKGTPDWTQDFLDGIQAGLHVRDACEQAKVDNSTPYIRRGEDEAFGKAWDVAAKIGTKALEHEANRRAFHGTDKPVFQGGALVGHIREYSDTLIMFLLKGRRPTKYRDNSKFEITGKDGGPVETKLSWDAMFTKPDVVNPVETRLREEALNLNGMNGTNGTNGKH